MPATEREATQPVTMRDLLASCAAASAVSTPPGRAQERAEAAVEDRAHQREGL
ncbi:hypothetical protein [Streptomyces hypolithicus]